MRWCRTWKRAPGTLAYAIRVIVVEPTWLQRASAGLVVIAAAAISVETFSVVVHYSPGPAPLALAFSLATIVLLSLGRDP